MELRSSSKSVAWVCCQVFVMAAVGRSPSVGSMCMVGDQSLSAAYCINVSTNDNRHVNALP